MNEHKFCFIICSNDELYLNECLHYINHLNIPDNYELDLLTISDASSMTSGYQEAMEYSDAKYKIYMHHDVFILNKNFLTDILNIFQSDNQIGLIGMVGYESISPNGIMWHAPRKGDIYKKKNISYYPPLSKYKYSLIKDGYTCVAEIDGLLMATSVDLPWNTEELKHWDFYDAFHSINFLENGYKIIVPTQKHPWVFHDDNVILNMFNYDKYRQLFLTKYKHLLGKHYSQILKQ